MIDLEPVSVRSDKGDTDRRIVERAPEPFLGFAQRRGLHLERLCVFLGLFGLKHRRLDVVQIHPVCKKYKEDHRNDRDQHSKAERVRDLYEKTGAQDSEKVGNERPDVLAFPSLPNGKRIF